MIGSGQTTTKADWDEKVIYSGKNAFVRFYNADIRYWSRFSQDWNQLAETYEGQILVLDVDCTRPQVIELVGLGCKGGQPIRYYLAGEEHLYYGQGEQVFENLNEFVQKNILEPVRQGPNDPIGPPVKARIFQLYALQTDGEYLWLGAIPEGIPTAVYIRPDPVSVGYLNVGIYASFNITQNMLRCFSVNSQIAWDKPIFNQPYKSNCRSVLNKFKPGLMTDTLLIRHEGESVPSGKRELERRRSL